MNARAGSGLVPAAPGSAPDAELRCLLWRCRRGMKELDVILERFAREALPAASPQERGTFAELLALPDPLLAQYLLSEATPSDPQMAHLTGRIRDLCRLRGAAAVFCP